MYYLSKQLQLIYITMYQMAMWKKCDIVKGVARRDEPAENHDLNLQFRS